MSRPLWQRFVGPWICILLLPLAAPAVQARVVKIERVSPPPIDLQVPVPGVSPAISADGRFVVFRHKDDYTIHLRDRQTGKTELISVSSSGVPADGPSYTPVISADGRFVAFRSTSTNLVSDGFFGIFLRDRLSGTTERVSTYTGFEYDPGSLAISGNGRFVVYQSYKDGLRVILLWDRQTAKTELVSVDSSGVSANGDSDHPAISADGRFVAFSSTAANLAPGAAISGVFVRDRQSGVTELVSVDPSGRPAPGLSWLPTISGDGRYVAFASLDNTLVAGDTNGVEDIFVRDRQAETTELISVSTNGGPSDWFSDTPIITPDGRFVIFHSGASNLASGGSDGVYVRDRQAKTTEFVSPGTPQAISGDGRLVLFTTAPMTNPNGGPCFLRDQVTHTTEPIVDSADTGQSPVNSGQPAISSDGLWVAFVTAGQVFERNRLTGMAMLVSGTPAGAPGDGESAAPALSADGRFVAFTSNADNLVPGDKNGAPDVFVWDAQTKKLELASAGVNGPPPASASRYHLAISGDGRYVAFATGHATIGVRDRQTGRIQEMPVGGACLSLALTADGRFVNFIIQAGDVDPGPQSGPIYVWDRQSGQTEAVVNSGSVAAISADGRFIAYAAFGIYVLDRQNGKTEPVSSNIGSDGTPMFAGSPALSSDGRFVAFVTGGDVAGSGSLLDRHVYVRDRQTRTTEPISVTAGGDPASGDEPAISADGRFIAFTSWEDDLVPGDTNGRSDVLIAERG